MWIEVVAQYGNEEAICPLYERSTWQVHQWHLQRKRGATLWGKEVWLVLFKRRFRCRHCHKVLMERDPACGSRRRTTIWNDRNFLLRILSRIHTD